MTIGDLVATLRLDIGQFKSGATQSEGILQKMGGSLGGLVAKGAALGAGFMGVNAIASTAKWGIQMAAEAEQAQVAFGTLLGSADAAQAMLKDLAGFAASTPFEMPELRTAARQLAAFGFDAKQVVPNLKMIGDIASGTGQPIAELAELYGKAKVQGRLFGEDINQLTGRGIPIIGELAKQFGVAESEVKKLVENGRVGFPELQKAFASMTGESGKFSGMMEAQSVTLAGVWSSFTDNASMIVADFFSWLAKEFNFTGLVTSATDFMAQTVNVIKWGIENWGLLWEIAYTSAALQIMRVGGEIAHLFTGVLPSLFSWFTENWSDIWFTSVDGALTILINFGKNVRGIMSAIWDFIMSGGTKPLELSWTPLTEGLKSTIRKLPEIPQREMGEVEKALQGQLSSLTETAATSFNEFSKKTAEGAMDAVEIADPTKASSTKKGAGKGSGATVALADSSEAYKLINSAASAQSTAYETYMKNLQSRQTKASEKTVQLLEKVAANTGVAAPAPEEVDLG